MSSRACLRHAGEAARFFLAFAVRRSAGAVRILHPGSFCGTEGPWLGFHHSRPMIPALPLWVAASLRLSVAAGLPTAGVPSALAVYPPGVYPDLSRPKSGPLLSELTDSLIDPVPIVPEGFGQHLVIRHHPNCRSCEALSKKVVSLCVLFATKIIFHCVCENPIQ